MKSLHPTCLCLAAALFIMCAAFPAHAKKNTKIGIGTSFTTGAAVPKGNLWEVKPRTSVGFSLSAGLRILFGHSCTEPTIFFVPHVIDTKKKGGSNGRFLSALVGMQVYPYNVLFIQPYFMFGAGFGWITYEGPYPPVPEREQSGKGKGIPILVGGGIDFNLYKWFSIGPTFFWNPVWWADCSKKIEMEMTPTLCNPDEERWILNFWLAGLRISFNFDF